MPEQPSAGTVRFENPLMPDDRLRKIYTAMVAMRLLGQHLGSARPKKNNPSKTSSKDAHTVVGEEAARASTALSLGAGDLILDAITAPGMALLLGATQVAGMKRSRPTKRGASSDATAFAQLLPTAHDSRDQLQRALGAAAALQVQAAGRILLVYLQPADLRHKVCRRALRAAADEHLPVIFLVLPDAHKTHSPSAGELARTSQGWGVPGFPVDGSDAIAIYRVMQESLLRSRAGGGPALLECIPFHHGSRARQHLEDPLARLEELLIAKGVANLAWLKRTRTAFNRQLAPLRK